MKTEENFGSMTHIFSSWLTLLERRIRKIIKVILRLYSKIAEKANEHFHLHCRRLQISSHTNTIVQKFHSLETLEKHEWKFSFPNIFVREKERVKKGKFRLLMLFSILFPSPTHERMKKKISTLKTTRFFGTESSLGIHLYEWASVSLSHSILLPRTVFFLFFLYSN